MKDRNSGFLSFIIFLGFCLFFETGLSGQQNVVKKEAVQEKIQIDRGDGSQVGSLQITTDQADNNNSQNADQANSDIKKTQTSKEVKQVRSSRPDLTKAKGARPPTIVRPSGSGIPKGLGRPGGAAGQGKR